MIDFNSLPIGATITATLIDKTISGKIYNIGTHKGKKVYDINTGGDPNDWRNNRFVYIHQITSAELPTS